MNNNQAVAEAPFKEILRKISALAKSDECVCHDKYGPDEVVCTLCKIVELADSRNK